MVGGVSEMDRSVEVSGETQDGSTATSVNYSFDHTPLRVDFWGNGYLMTANREKNSGKTWRWNKVRFGQGKTKVYRCYISGWCCGMRGSQWIKHGCIEVDQLAVNYAGLTGHGNIWDAGQKWAWCNGCKFCILCLGHKMDSLHWAGRGYCNRVTRLLRGSFRWHFNNFFKYYLMHLSMCYLGVWVLHWMGEWAFHRKGVGGYSCCAAEVAQIHWAHNGLFLGVGCIRSRYCLHGSNLQEMLAWYWGWAVTGERSYRAGSGSYVIRMGLHQWVGCEICLGYAAKIYSHNSKLYTGYILLGWAMGNNLGGSSSVSPCFLVAARRTMAIWLHGLGWAGLG
ncbi:hypothetical protein E3N88_22408 [Mikania micrantha]|uniref:Uncharacterized protein n=1 Tax=Mikania micrantha TaxID=192012 RepID=A0A5N6NBZ9_9ASTR|nr:hypothetical protein E3N88_22408 [Mikania micrantha]